MIRAGTRRAEQAAGRMDPPLLLCLDECANIVKISDLPDLYSHLGSRGIIPVTILQSAEQGERVWGREGFATLWSAATIKVIGAGIDSAKMAEDISKLIGDHDVAVRSAATAATPPPRRRCGSNASSPPTGCAPCCPRPKPWCCPPVPASHWFRTALVRQRASQPDQRGPRRRPRRDPSPRTRHQQNGQHAGPDRRSRRDC